MFSVSIKEAEHSDQDPKFGRGESPYPILIDPAGEIIKTLQQAQKGTSSVLAMTRNAHSSPHMRQITVFLFLFPSLDTRGAN